MPRKLRSVPPTPETPPSAEDIRDKLLRAASLRADALEKLATNPGDEDFPAYELQSLLRSVSEVADGELREMRAWAKLTPAEREAIKAAQADLGKVANG